ncbi:tripartite tricarboxylate transporter substrate binding protein [Aminobacter sp. MSH1]|uniref:Bug family tripartite tricarboxylate transporter substrate binding protein n=1 Tax=Aminobacter sp. MSH1 TaxID=374606 RepID=UPI000D346953|nr:tripartite tricarboxylate transporter substrate binding protein [Aminobacter sp. MSH1]
MKRFLRQTIAIVTGIAATVSMISPLVAEEAYPSREVTMLVPYTAGGPTDLLARALGAALGAIWKKPVVIDNRPGGSETIAAQAVVHADPDGYTLLFGADPTFAGNMYLYSKLPYDTDEDLVPVVHLANVFMGLSVSSSLGVSSMKEFIELASKNPKNYSYGSSGIGSTTHLAMDEIAHDQHIELIHVPYKGTSQAVQDLVGGRIQAMLSNGLVTLPFIKTGELRMLAFDGTTRNAGYPNVPTFAEAGYPQVSAGYFYGLAAPANTPKAVIDKIAADVKTVLADKEFVAKHFSPLGLIPVGTGPEDFTKFIGDQRAIMKRRVEVSSVKLD